MYRRLTDGAAVRLARIVRGTTPTVAADAVVGFVADGDPQRHRPIRWREKGKMDCQEFLEGYSSYLDGVASPTEKAEFDEHLDRCEACARYDRVVQRGLKIFRNLPRVQTSSDFLPRLRHRLYHVDDAIPERSKTSGGSAALVAVAAVGILALSWMPFATRVPVEVELPAVSVEAPPPESAESLPSLFDRGPFLTPDRSYSSPGLFPERAGGVPNWTYPPTDASTTGALLLVGAGSGTPVGR